jgi:hypothetical protein
MKESVYKDQFVRRFDEVGRSDNFSTPARYALFEYFDELEQDLGEEIEFDVIAICCDYAEYESLQSFADSQFANIQQAFEELGLEIDMSGTEFEADSDDIDDAIREYIHDHGQLIEFDGGIIVSSF